MQPNEKKTLLQGTLDMLVLKALQSGSKHGYQITNWLERTSNKQLIVEEGSLYPALHRMERRGWIESSWGTSESNRRAKYYKLTRTGRSQLTQQISSWDALANAIGLIVHPVEGEPS